MTKKHLGAAVALASFMVAAACNGDPSPAGPQPAVVVLLDATRSTLDPETSVGETPSGETIRAKYLEELQEVLDECEVEACTLTLVGVSNSPSTAPTSETFDFADVREGSEAEDQFLIRADVTLEAERILGRNEGESFTEHAPGECTELIGAFNVAGDVLAGGGERPRRIVAFTDGFSSCEPDLVELVKSDAWTGGEDVIAGLEEDGRVPDLDDVTVWMIGFGQVRTGRDPLTEAEVGRIRQFWETFVSTTGGQFAPGGISPRLGTYPEAGS